MVKRTAFVAFMLGLVVAAAIGVAAATSTSVAGAPTDGRSLIIQNVSPLELTFSIEVNGQTIPLGATKSGEVLKAQDALVVGGLLSSLQGDELTIHARQTNGNEFFTLMIDRDELLQRQGVLSIPGPGGRRQAAALIGKPTVAPAPTTVP